MKLLTDEEKSGTWVGRVWRPGTGPSVVTLRDGNVVDITSRRAPTVRDVLELDDPVAHVRGSEGEVTGSLDAACGASERKDSLSWLAPCDLQAVKACGVTFAR
ncbi:MAG: fumarylacetoacetate hydrolase, partial [Boseongicola sp.]|nr:fumarylacetoacetate hydrolase [Boseongicola sp.]